MKLRPFPNPILFEVIGLCPRVLAADSEVEDSFIGDRKTARLAFVSADKGTTLADKETGMLVFTEKDHSKEKRPDIMASFGDFGSGSPLPFIRTRERLRGSMWCMRRRRENRSVHSDRWS